MVNPQDSGSPSSQESKGTKVSCSIDTFFKPKKKVVSSINMGNKTKSVYDVSGPSRSKKSKPKKRSLRNTSSEAQPNSPQVPGPLMGHNDAQPKFVASIRNSEEDEIFSTWIILCSDPISDTDVVHCNGRFWNNVEPNVGEKVWKAITNLGIKATDVRRDNQKIDLMEKLAREQEEGLKESTKEVP